jgi:murein DD-endopeptidase MepM/ murein hydrolase activator NlpD
MDPEGPLKKIRKSLFNNPFICLGSFSLILGLLVSISIDNYSLALTNEKTEEIDNLFLASAKVSWVDSPDFLLVGENSVAPLSPPVIFTPQILGTLTGNFEEYQSQFKKGVAEYVVTEGDTMSSVAEKFNIDINTIAWANNISTKATLKEGKKLVILPTSGVLHLVQKGETLGGIAMMYKVSSEKIEENNDIDDNKIFYGDLLVIPGGKKIYTPAVKYASVSSSYFIAPTKGTISQTSHFYNAVDIANKCGTPIYAAAGGKVYTVKRNTWPGGNYIKIEHNNGLITYYGHLSSMIVYPGQEVAKGQRIGYMGNTGLTVGATGCHLHFDLLTRSMSNPFSRYRVGSYISW